MKTLFVVPWDSGHRGKRMGAGPWRLQQELGWSGGEEIDVADGFTTEIGTSFALYGRLAERIRAKGDAVPVVFSGNCGASIGTASGAGTSGLGVLWFDAHGDFNTPETSPSGYLDGMALAVLSGLCFSPLTAKIPGFVPVSPDVIVHAGGHDLDPPEDAAFSRLDVGRIRPGDDGSTTLETLRAKVSRLLVHIDLDVMDPAHGRANQYAREGGFSPDEVVEILRRARERFEIAGVVVASYDPAYDGDGRVAAAGARFVREIVEWQSSG